MNETNEPTSPSTSPLEITPATSIGTSLCQPADLVAALQRPKSATLTAALFAFAMIALAAYGALVGSFTGGWQMWHITLKIPLRFLPLGGRAQSYYPAHAGVEALGDGFGPFNSKQPIEFEGKTYFLKAANEINKNTTECQ